MRKDVKMESECRVGTGRVSLTVQIGNGQVGSSIVFFSDSHGTLGNGEIKDMFIGNGTDIKGKILKVLSQVTDRNTHSNDMIISYLFNGLESQSKPLQLSATADNEGETVNFSATFNII
jgi:hypothetical protein